MKKMLFLLLFILGLWSSPCFADSNITFIWDANTESDLAGYRLYQSAIPESYIFGSGYEKVDITMGTETATLSNVVDGTWYWVVTAYDAEGNESGPSNEVMMTLDTTPPGVPQGFQITIIIRVEVP